jgi:SAM-dependent methyltransferase
MRLMERRVGSAALVVGIDADAALGELALASLHAAGHRRCRFIARDLTEDGPIPGRPYDLVYTRLLLSHLPARVAVLERLWDAVAPGGHLLVQDYDLRTASVLPELDSAAEVKRVLVSTFIAAGCDVHAGAHLAQLFEAAGLGEPDGTDVAGRIEPLATGSAYLESSFRSVLPAAIAHGVTTAAEADATLAALADDAARHPEAALLWPLMIGAWKRKEG